MFTCISCKIRFVAYRISSIRRHGYYLFCCLFCAATIQGRLPLKGGVYFFGKPGDIIDGWIRYVQVRQWRLLDTVSSTQSLSPAVSCGNDSYNTNSSSASVVTIIRNHSHMCACAAFTSRGYYSGRYLFRSRALDCTATIWGRRLFEGADYLRVPTLWGRRLFKEIQ